MNGFITLHRQLKDWEWYTDNPVKCLFLELLLTANHKPTRYKGYAIERGQTITGYPALSEATGLSVQQLRTAMKKLKSTGEVTVKSTVKFSIVTICKYNQYQDQREPEQQAHQQASNRLPTTPEQGNKTTERESSRFVPPTIEEATAHFLAKGSTADQAGIFIDFYSSKGWMVGKNKMKLWRNAASGWIKRNSNGGHHGQKAPRTYKQELAAELLREKVIEANNGRADEQGHQGMERPIQPTEDAGRGSDVSVHVSGGSKLRRIINN